MKKVLALLLAAAMCAAALTGCGGGDKPKETEKPDNGKSDTTASTKPDTKIPEIPGEVFDAGNVQALVPEGWKAFPQKDMIADDGTMDPDVISICKGAETELDLMFKPFVRIDYYGPDTEMGGGLKDWYSNTEDLEPVQAGLYTWEGFTTTDYGLMAVLVAEDGKHQYQAPVYLKTDDGSISLEDKDVLAILASVKPSDGTAGNGGASSGGGEAVPTGNYDWWEGDWYGWWAIKNGTGVYQKPSEMNLVWDAFAEIEVYNDNTGRVTIWDTGTSRDEAMIIAYDITYEPGVSELGRLVSKRVDFFPYGHWNNGMEADTMSEREVGWTIDPADSTVSHFENMLEITGRYESPENPDDSFDYYIYLRPWGTKWDDVRNGNTEGCLYKDMMPLYHDDWYTSLLNLGHERPTSTFQEGIDIINDYLANQGGSSGAGGVLDPAAKEGADGKVDMATLKTALAWCKENASYSTPYDEIAAQFGVHGKQIESFFENNTIYRWWATEDAYVQITFTLGSDGSELWNVTQYDGIR